MGEGELVAKLRRLNDYTANYLFAIGEIGAILLFGGSDFYLSSTPVNIWPENFMELNLQSRIQLVGQ